MATDNRSIPGRDEMVKGRERIQCPFCSLFLKVHEWPKHACALKIGDNLACPWCFQTFPFERGLREKCLSHLRDCFLVSEEKSATRKSSAAGTAEEDDGDREGLAREQEKMDGRMALLRLGSQEAKCLLEEKDKRLRGKISRLTDDRRSMKYLRKKIDDQDRKLEGLNAELKCLERGLKNGVVKLEDVNGKMIGLNRQLEDMNGKMRDLNRQVENVEREMKNLKRERKKRYGRMKNLNRQLGNKKIKLEDINGEMNDLSRQVGNEKLKLEDVKIKLEDVNAM